MYNIHLKRIDEMERGKPIYRNGVFATPDVVTSMSRHLYLKLAQLGILPTVEQWYQDLLKVKTQRFDGFNVLTQIIRPVLPILQDFKTVVQPSWEKSSKNLFVLQSLLTDFFFFQLEESKNQQYDKQKLSIVFLTICSNSQQYC